MKITFKNKKTEMQFSSSYKKKWKYPKHISMKLEKVETFIKNASSFEDIALHIPYHLERLAGKRKTEWSIRVPNTGYRVTLIPCDEDGDELIEGDIISKCKSIKIVKITEVSNHYE